MITKTTNLDSQYMELFEEIGRKSESQGKKIIVRNLEEFFGSIQEIAALDSKFLRLPLDEPMFEIDANSRKINVDATPFKANGLSVQGDHLAETVFFKIDRYYDTMDLMNTDIYVNWKMGSASGRDECSIKSDSIISGYIVFAWPIHDKITAKSGSLQFSIQLNIEQDGKNAYALNTLPATLNIKEGLVLTNPEVLDMENNIKSILINSSFGDGTAAVGEVKWATGNGNGLVRTLGGNFEEVINLVANNTDGVLSSVPVKLYALAAAGRDAVISYSDSNKNPITNPTYLKVDENSLLDDNVIYYTLQQSGNYLPATVNEIRAFGSGSDAEVPLYVAVAEVTLDKVGSYTVNAQGVKYDSSTNVKIGASPLVESKAVRVPEAEAPISVLVTIPEQEYDPRYTITPGTETIFLAEKTMLELTASAEMPASGFGLLDFVWKKDGETDPVKREGFVKTNLSVLEVSEEGSYTVDVKHYRNGDTIKSISSKPYLVSYYASPLTATMQAITNNRLELEKSVKGSYTKGAQGTVKINYAFETNKPYSSEIKFELILAETGEVVPATFTKEIEGVEKCVINSADLPGDGLYNFRVSNMYNGSIFSIETAGFTIDIKD